MKIEEQELTDLVSRYLDNALSEEETASLMEAVRSVPGASDLLRDMALQHVQLRRLYREKEWTASPRELGMASFSGPFAPVRRAMAIAAVLVLMAACAFWLVGLALERPAGELTMSLIGAGGDMTEAADPRAAPDGTAVVAPPGSIQLLRFKDGTIVQLAPASIAEIVDDGVEGGGQSCKVIRLVSGLLMADIARQRPEFPLKILTPHAEIIVVGTRLTCRVDKDRTHVMMHSGWAYVRHAVSGEKIRLAKGFHVLVGKMHPFMARHFHEREH